jgi:alpha-tubulin suppressor-like RCC1 family protein
MIIPSFKAGILTFIRKIVAAIPTNGKLFIWGNNNAGQVGNSTTGVVPAQNVSSPVQVGTATDWNVVSFGNGHILATKTGGSLWSWGYGGFGQLGSGTTTSLSSPVQVGSGTDWASVSAGGRASFAIKTNGTLWAWGRNTYGQLGLGNTTSRSSPVQVGTGTDWASVFVGEYHTIALKTTGTLWGWGRNNAGQLGLGDTTNRSSPVQVGTDTNWSKVSSGRQHTLAVKSNGTLWAWGNNGYGRLGLRDTNNRSSPVQVGTDTNWSIVDAGYTHSHAIRTTGTLWSFGANVLRGELGVGDQVNRSSPVQVGANTDWINVGAGRNASIARRSNKTLWAWGSSAYGLLVFENGRAYNLRISKPTLISNDTWSSFTAKRDHTFGIKTTGTLWAWGKNFSGVLGTGNEVNQSSPVQIGSGTDWSSIGSAATTDRFTVAIKTNGSLWTWGLGTYGRLGSGNNNSRSSPVQVGTDTNWASTSSSPYHTLAVKTNGTLWAWGRGAHGQLGNDSFVTRSSPVQIGSDSNWASVSAGGLATNDAQSFAVKTTGTLWAWGNNNYGKLGLGTLARDRTSSPVQVGTDTNWSLVGGNAGFGGSTIAVKTTGTLWVWGRNNSYHLGLIYSYVSRFSPTQQTVIGLRLQWDILLHLQ